MINKAAAQPFCRYIWRHWHGENPLGFAFGVNMVAATTLTTTAIPLFSYVGMFIGYAVLALLYAAIVWSFLLVFAAWQMVGVWRSAANAKVINRRSVWSIFAQTWILLCVIFLTHAVWQTAYPQLRFALLSVFNPNLLMPDYTITPEQKNGQLHVAGGFRYGITRDIKSALNAVSGIDVIVFNSRGGMALEGRKLYFFIKELGLRTHAAGYCESACAMAFLGGRERTIDTINGKLGFHRDGFPVTTNQTKLTLWSHVATVLISAEVSGFFFNRVMSTPSTDMWYPSQQDLERHHITTG